MSSKTERTPIKFTREERAAARQAASALVKGGWCQGSFGYPGGPHCLVGAVRHDQPINYWCKEPADTLEDKLDDLLGGAVAFNDHPKRKLEDVLGVLDAVAKVGVL